MIKIIQRSKKLKTLKGIIPFTIILISICIWIYNEYNPNAPSSKLYILIASLIYFAWFALTMYSIFFMKSFKVIGEVRFKKEQLIIQNKKIKINDIESVGIIVRGYYGQPTGGTFYVKQGDDNEIEIKYKSGKTKRNEFLLSNKRELESLKRVVQYYKTSNFKIELSIRI